MKKLVRRRRFFLAAAVFGIAVFFALVFLRPGAFLPLWAPILAASFLAGGFFVKTGRDISEARLIIENEIIRICPATLQYANKSALQRSCSVEVFVSCFGILFDHKIIKFNQGKVRLEAVLLGKDFIELSFGTKSRTQKARLVHECIPDDDLERISNRFSYETGIFPILAR